MGNSPEHRLGQGENDSGVSPVILEDCLATRCLYLFGTVDSQSTCSVIAMLHNMVAVSNDPVYIFVCSYGGEIECGYALIDTISFLARLCPIHIVATGAAMSMGAVLVAHGSRGCRHATTSTTFMLHDFATALGQDYVRHQAASASFLSTDFDRKQALLARRLSVSSAHLKKLMRSSYWLNAEQAQTIGLIDDIIPLEPTNAHPLVQHLLRIRRQCDGQRSETGQKNR